MPRPLPSLAFVAKAFAAIAFAAMLAALALAPSPLEAQTAAATESAQPEPGAEAAPRAQRPRGEARGDAQGGDGAPRRAQGGAQGSTQAERRGTSQEEPRSARRLPADSLTRHSLALPDRTLAFAAVAGSVRLTDDKGDAEAEIAYVYYRLDGGDAKTRPIAFFFNGGPGSASAWLHLGLAGPWRLPLAGEAASPSATPELLPNAETWLDFADLVFIDPVGTGWSRFATQDEATRKRLLSVEGDARAVAQTIRRVVLKHERLLSPKYIVGESYGGVRGPKVAYDLVSRQGVGVNGLVLVSPILDFAPYAGASLLQPTWFLPSMTAAARELRGPVTRADLADVEAYAAGELMADMLRGQADAQATERMARKVADFTGIDPAIVRRAAGRLSPTEFRRELDRKTGRVAGRYDASVFGRDPFPESSVPHFSDPSADPLTAPLTAAVVDLTTRRLNWRVEAAYRLLNLSVNTSWDYGRGAAESVTQLRQLLALDPRFKLLVAHGLFDLAAPYFGSKITLDQLPDLGRERITLTTLPGGHMFYSRDAARKEFRAAAEATLK